MNKISITEIRKGARVRLRHTGWLATVMDNTVKSHTRVCDVEGDFREMGSVYSTDIVEALIPHANGGPATWYKVEHTPGQVKAAKSRAGFGF